MTLRNTEFRITFRSKADRFYYYFAKDTGTRSLPRATGTKRLPAKC